VRPGLKLIRSRDNPQVKALVKLAGSSRERRETGTTLLEGEHLVRAYRDSGGKAETIFASEAAMAKPEVRALLESAPAKARIVLADRLVDQISQLVSAAGVGAVVRTPESGLLPRGGIARFYGTAKIHKSGPIYEEIWNRLIEPEKKSDPDKKGFGVLIKVERAEDLGGAPLAI